VTADVIRHRLAFALRVEDHFSASPIDETLDIAIDSEEAGVRSRAGSLRHDDGTYRWSDLGDGIRELTITSPSKRWINWEPVPLEVSVPLADPREAVRYEMWPTPLASVTPGLSAIRGKLLGTGVGRVRIEVAGAGQPPTGRYTFSDEAGEFLYLLTGGHWPITTVGTLALQITVVGRTVTGSDIAGDGSFVGDHFELPPLRDMRVRFHVT
jgi:hypothetical protein